MTGIQTELEINRHIAGVNRMLDIAAEAFFKELPLTTQAFDILECIDSGIRTSSGIAEHLNTSLSSVAQKTKLLEKNRLIRRKVDPVDKRIWTFTTTKKAQKIIKLVNEINFKSSSHLYSFMSDREKETFLNTLKQIKSRLEFAVKHKMV